MSCSQTRTCRRLAVRVSLIAALCAILPFPAAAQTEDLTPPVLTGFSLTPSTIDTTAGPATVTVTCSATDDLAGLSHAVVNFSSPAAGQLQQAICSFSGALSQTVTATVTLPQFSEAGAWTVSVEIMDRLSNSAVVDLAAAGFPTHLQVISVSDTTAPALTALTLDPAGVDTSAGPATVTVTCSATDDLSGLSHAVINFSSPSHGQLQQAICFFDGTTNATTVTSVTFPQFSEAGLWTASVEIMDRLSNSAVVDLAAGGFPSSISIQSLQDVTAPELTGFALSPSSINTAAGPATVTVTCSATDDIAGLSHAVVSFSSPSGAQYQQAICWFSGALAETTFATIQFPQFSEGGAWTVSLEVMDRLSNSAVPDLGGMGLPNRLTINNTVPVPIDIKPGSFPNSVNGRSRGTIPVALLSADGFDALRVILSSLTFGATGDEASLAFCNPHGEDVNGDGRLDLVCHFNTIAASFRDGDVAGILKATTVDGTRIKGVDVVRVVR